MLQCPYHPSDFTGSSSLTPSKQSGRSNVVASLYFLEFGFDKDELDIYLRGLIALSLFLVGDLVSFAAEWLADCVWRSPLYGATVFLGKASCLGTYFVHNYPHMFVTQILTGVSICGTIPVMYSVLGDLYPVNQSLSILAFVLTWSGLVAGIWQALSGFLGNHYGWRLTFLIVSVPGLVCSMLLFYIKDPKRGHKEAAWTQIDEE